MPDTLSDWLSRRFPDSSQRALKAMVSARRVLINGVAARALKVELAAGDRVEVLNRAAAEGDRLAPLRRVHEDQDVIVVEKPPGLLTSTNARERRPTTLALVARHVRPSEAFVVHRLDRDAAGLLVLAKNHASERRLKDQFFHHSVERRYVAVVPGVMRPARGRIESDLVERADGTVRSTRPGERGKHAVTDYVVRREARNRSLIDVTLQTGRKHQIRAHLAERGHPLVGDVLYGGTKTPGGRLGLAAVHLAFDHPRSGARLSFSIEPPDELLALIDAG